MREERPRFAGPTEPFFPHDVQNEADLCRQRVLETPVLAS